MRRYRLGAYLKWPCGLEIRPRRGRRNTVIDRAVLEQHADDAARLSAGTASRTTPPVARDTERAMSQENVEVLRTAYAQAAARRVDCDGVTHNRDRGN
jgi:hypothetical protein